MDGEDDDEIGDISQRFHNTVRENTIYMIFFLTLLICSWVIIGRFLKKRDRAGGEEDESESVVYTICFWICVFSLAISMGASLLLPMSVLANEVLLLYPKTYGIQWLNELLIQGLWNLIFLFSNSSIFLLLPFAYFFIESEGFSGHKKGVLSKFKEAAVVLLLSGFTLLGMTHILALVLAPEKTSFIQFFNQLPLLYSCISFIGVLLLLVCTPTGSAHLFTVLSQFMRAPQFMRNIDDEYTVAQLEVESLRNRLNYRNGQVNGDHRGKEYQKKLESIGNLVRHDSSQFLRCAELKEMERLKELMILKKSSKWKTDLLYPFAYVLLLALTGFTVFLVVINTVQLLFGVKSLPVEAQPLALGLSSMSVLGTWGAALEIVIIFYLMATSVVGLYNLPGIKNHRPRVNDSPLTHIIYNCVYVLTLSSALPLLARIIGVTNFDLLGNYGRIEWLGNFYIVFFTNVIFSGACILCLVSKFTVTIRQELVQRLKNAFRLIFESKSARAGVNKED